MSALAQPTIQLGPEWVVPEMPPGYQNRVSEIQRLVADLEAMSRFGRLLWQVGPALAEGVREVFVVLKYDVEAVKGAPSAVAVRLDGKRRLLIQTSAMEEPIQKKSADLAHVFQMLHEVAEETDRVVLVVNTQPGMPLADRSEPLTAEASTFLRRMGATYVAAPTVFRLWKLSLQDHDRARTHVERLHAQDGGAFDLPPSVIK